MSEQGKLNFEFVVYTFVISWSCLGASGEITPKVVNGRNADVGEFPYIVSLFAEGQPQCGGTIIQENVIVTAAHCTVFDPVTIIVTAGEHDLTKSSGNEQVVQGVRYIVHESFNKPLDFENDIAFLIVDPPFRFNEFVKPVKLPSTDLVHPEKATVAGWGRLAHMGPTPQILQTVELPFVDDYRCNQIFEGNIADTMMCYGGGNDQKDSCQGDSGGPLVCWESKDKVFVLCGIVSFGADCGTPGFPGVYTDVAKFINWIQTSLGKVSSGMQNETMTSNPKKEKMTTPSPRWNDHQMPEFPSFSEEEEEMQEPRLATLCRLEMEGNDGDWRMRCNQERV